MDLFATNFGTIDWIIVCVYICIPLCIGIYCKRYITSSGDFIVAGRNLRLFLAVATLTGTELGLVTIMYSAEAGFINGFSAFHIGVIEAAAVLAIGLTGFIVYKLRESRVMTIPEYYEKRYNQKVRIIGGIVLALGGILNMGLFLQAGARFMMGVTGVGNPAMLKIFMTIMLVMVLIYTVAGGMVSLAINDYMQFVVLSLGLLIGSVFVIREIGWSALFTIPEVADKTFTFNPVSKDSGFGPIYVIFMVMLSVSAGALWQAATMRALAAKSPKVAKNLYACASIAYLMRKVVPMLWGIGAFIFLANAPHLMEQFKAGSYSSQFGMPIFIAKIIPSGLLGLIAAGMFAAFMSTHDSYLLSWSSVITQDIISPLRGGLDDKTRLFINRVTIVCIGVFLLIFGLYIEAPVSLWNYMAVTGTIYLSGAFTVIVAGLYWKKASSTGAVIALLTGLIAVLGIIPSIANSGIWYLSDKFIGVSTFIICALGMIIGSLMFPDKQTRGEVQ